MIIGQWPYQTASVKRGILVFIIVAGSSQLVPQIVAIVKNHNDLEFLLMSASPLVFVVGLTVRLVSTVWNAQNVSNILENYYTIVIDPTGR